MPASTPATEVAGPQAPADVSPPQPISAVERHLQSRYRDAARFGPFVPLLLATFALAAWFALQTWLLLDEQSRLKAAHASQQQTVDNATRLRQSLDAVATDTQRLADAGNANARLLVEELRRRGVTINPNPPAAANPAK